MGWVSVPGSDAMQWQEDAPAAAMPGLLGSIPGSDRNLAIALTGMGLLGGNYGRSRGEAFSNAVQGGSQMGMMGLQQAIGNQSRQQQLALQRQAQDTQRSQFDQTFGLQRDQFNAQEAQRQRQLQLQDAFGRAIQQGMAPPPPGAPVGQMGIGSGLGGSARPQMPQQPNINAVLGNILNTNPALAPLIKSYRDAMPEVGSTQEIAGPDGTPIKQMMDKQGNPLGSFAGYQAQFDPRVIPQAVAKETALIPPRVALETQLGPVKAAIARAGKTDVNLAVNTDKTFAGEIAQVAGRQFGDENASARGALNTIQVTNTIRDLVSSGKVIVGPGADMRIAAARIGEALGVGGKDNAEKLKNTSVLMQNLAKSELAAAEQMKGQGQITESERVIIKRSAAGDPNMTGGELVELSNALDKVARLKIRANNARVEQLSKNPQFGVLPSFMTIPEPPAYTGGFRVLGPEK